MELNSGSSSRDTTSSGPSLVGSPLCVVPFIAISPRGEPLDIGSSSCPTRRLMLQFDFDEEADPSRATFNPSPSVHSLGSKIIEVIPPAQSLESNEELIKLLCDVKEVATAEVDLN